MGKDTGRLVTWEFPLRTALVWTLNLGADFGQAPARRSKPMFTPNKKVVQVVSDLFSFRSVNENQPPILLLLDFVLSRCHMLATAVANNFGLPAQAPTSRPPHPCFCPRSGNFSGVDGAGRSSGIRTSGVKGAYTGRFAALSAALKLPSTTKYRTLHCLVRRIPLRIAVYISRPRSHTTTCVLPSTNSLSWKLALNWYPITIRC